MMLTCCAAGQQLARVEAGLARLADGEHKLTHLSAQLAGSVSERRAPETFDQRPQLQHNPQPRNQARAATARSTHPPPAPAVRTIRQPQVPSLDLQEVNESRLRESTSRQPKPVSDLSHMLSATVACAATLRAEMSSIVMPFEHLKAQSAADLCPA